MPLCKVAYTILEYQREDMMWYISHACSVVAQPFFLIATIWQRVQFVEYKTHNLGDSVFFILKAQSCRG